MSSTIIELVAKNNGRFFVHEGILSHHSQQFKDATSGPWKESQERKILLQDWDEETVGRLVQYLYTGDYRYPNPSLPEKPPGGVAETETEKVPSAPELGRTGALTPFAECVQGTAWEHPGLPMTDASWLESVNTVEFDFEETFLAHAKVYTLAQYKSIVALKVLAHKRLSQTLLKLHPLGRNPHLAANITTLSAYVYAHTDSLTSSEEPIRRIVSQYVALNFAAWQADPQAEQMMCDGGDFVKDVLRKICRRFGGTGLGGIRLTPALTRYIERFSVGWSRFGDAPGMADQCEGRRPGSHTTRVHPGTRRPDREREIRSAKVIHKFILRMILAYTRMHRVWLIPIYTSDPTKAATNFYLEQFGGLAVSAVLGQSCGSKCAINVYSAPNARTGIVDIVTVRCRQYFLDLTMFPGFDGILTHTAHVAGEESLHFLWKSMGLPPAKG